MDQTFDYRTAGFVVQQTELPNSFFAFYAAYVCSTCLSPDYALSEKMTPNLFAP